MKINIISIHFYLFGQIFIIFMGIFGTQKMLMHSFLGGRGSQKVYGLYTHHNVDIYERPRRQNVIYVNDQKWELVAFLCYFQIP